MREPCRSPARKRVTTTRNCSPCSAAASSSGMPATLIEAIAYLESWGDARAESPAGPKGIMQISAATARSMGLKVLIATRYRVTRERSRSRQGQEGAVRTSRTGLRTWSRIRDERLYPERAIPAAARYLAGMEQKFGGRDWAIFAYHCGQGCVAEMQELTRRARGIPKDELTVPRMFFSHSPAWNANCTRPSSSRCSAIGRPTYYFRIRRAEELLAMYRRDPGGLHRAWPSSTAASSSAAGRAPHRLSVWLKRDDMVFRSCDDIRVDLGKRLVRRWTGRTISATRLRVSPDTPADLEYFQQASPSRSGGADLHRI